MGSGACGSRCSVHCFGAGISHGPQSDWLGSGLFGLAPVDQSVFPRKKLVSFGHVTSVNKSSQLLSERGNGCGLFTTNVLSPNGEA